MIASFRFCASSGVGGGQGDQSVNIGSIGEEGEERSLVCWRKKNHLVNIPTWKVDNKQQVVFLVSLYDNRLYCDVIGSRDIPAHPVLSVTLHILIIAT